jgi:hypothetical protein
MREVGNRRCLLGQFDSDQDAGKRSVVVEILKIQIMIRRQIFPAFVGVAVLRLKPVADHEDKVGIENLRGSKQRSVVKFSFHIQTADSVKAIGSHKFVLLPGASISVTAPVYRRLTYRQSEKLNFVDQIFGFSAFIAVAKLSMTLKATFFTQVRSGIREKPHVAVGAVLKIRLIVVHK